MPYFSGVTLLITHYNRSASLARLLATFRQLDCQFEDVVVSDDGSKPAHQERLLELKEKFNFRLITTPKNKGLGNNINKGQDAVATPYTVYIQEDFVPKSSFAEHFADALEFMQKDATIDTARFYGYFKYPYTKPYGKGFLEMVFKASPLYSNHLKFYYYSDHPHLRRSNFFDKFGRYPEGIKGDLTEFHMALSYIKNKGRGLIFSDLTGMIDQSNDSAEPSTMNRSNWRESNNPAALVLRSFYLKYRLAKNTMQLFLFDKSNTK